MKTHNLKKAFTYLLAFVLLSGCSYKKIDKETIANLKASLNAEYISNAKYNAYSKKAEKEGYFQIAKLFKALAIAESVHTGKFEKVLSAAGVKFEKTDPVFPMDATEKNLQYSIKDEIQDMDVIYPNYMLQAENSVIKSAYLTFSEVCEAEKSHKSLLALIYDVLMTGVVTLKNQAVQSKPLKANLTKIEELFSKTDYYICPEDGRVFDKSSYAQGCNSCNTSKDKLIVVSENSDSVKVSK